jgi:hypothetical protein
LKKFFAIRENSFFDYLIRGGVMSLLPCHSNIQPIPVQAQSCERTAQPVDRSVHQEVGSRGQELVQAVAQNNFVLAGSILQQGTDRIVKAELGQAMVDALPRSFDFAVQILQTGRSFSAADRFEVFMEAAQNKRVDIMNWMDAQAPVPKWWFQRAREYYAQQK